MDFSQVWDRCSLRRQESVSGAREAQRESPEAVDKKSGDCDSGDPSSTSCSPSSSSSMSSAAKRRKRTAAAREASLKVRARKQLAGQLALLPKPSEAETYMPDLQANGRICQPGGESHHQIIRTRRLRLIWSWFMAACKVINDLCESHTVAHVLDISVIDDTNMRLSKTVEGAWQSTRTTTILNNCQTCVFCYKKEAPGEPMSYEHKAFSAHTPMCSLSRATTSKLMVELSSWFFCFFGQPGTRWERLGIKPTFTSKIPIQGTMLTFDSLKTNLALLKRLRCASFQKHQAAKGSDQGVPGPCIFPVIGVICAIHQLSLARKSLLFFHTGFWSSLVRLGHLFSVNNFRNQFRSALFSEIAENFSFIVVDQLPRDHAEWYRDRSQRCNILTSDGRYRTKRLLHHLALCRYDNGQPDSETFAHWCTGSCCRGSSVAEKSEFCFLQLCKYYFYLFAFGFQVPLAYRWKHAAPALQFCKDTGLICFDEKVMK